MDRPVFLLIEDVPETLRAAVEADAAERDTNRNDVICELLAYRFKVRYTPSGYPYRPGEATQWNLRMPAELREAIRQHAKSISTERRKISQRGLVIATLQAHYDLPVDSPRRRPSQEQLPPDLVRDARARHEAGESFRALSRRYGVRRETLAKAIRSAA